MPIVDQHRIEIRLLDPVLFGDQLRVTGHHVHQCFDVGFGPLSIAVQKWPALQGLQHRHQSFGGNRGQTDGTVFEEFGCYATEPYQDDRSKDRVVFRSKDQLDAVSPMDHGLDCDSLDRRIRPRFRYASFDAVKRVCDRFRILEGKQHASHIGFVGDLRRVDFEYDRIPEGICQRDGLVCIRSDFDRGGRNSIQVQQSLGIDLREDGSRRAVLWSKRIESFQEAFSFEPLGSLFRAVGFLVVSSERSVCNGRFGNAKPSIAFLVFDQSNQAANCLFGSIEISDAVGLEYFDPCLHR